MREDILKSSQLSFIGKVLSVFTHEVKNHLAIIKESAGLLGDLIEMGKTSSPQDLQQSLKIVQSIENQIGKTSWLCSHLNSFSHRMDKALSTFSVNECIEELIVLLQRLANQRRISLEKDFAEDKLLINSNPSEIQLIIFCFIERYLKMLDKDSIIVIKTYRSDNSIAISIIPKGTIIKTDEEAICSDEVYESFINQLGGSVSKEGISGGIIIMLPVSSL